MGTYDLTPSTDCVGVAGVGKYTPLQWLEIIVQL
jgi:hypothetical protein